MVLAGNNRIICIFQLNRPRAQTHEAYGGAVRRIGEPSGKIKLQVRAGSRAGDVGTECLESNLGLAECCSERASGNEVWLCLWRLREPWKILIFHGSALVLHNYEHDS